MEELHQRLSSHEGVRFQILARQQNGPDVVLAEAMLSSSALMELAIDSENALDQDAELPGRDFTIEAVVDTVLTWSSTAASSRRISSETVPRNPASRSSAALCAACACSCAAWRERRRSSSAPWLERRSAAPV